MTLKGSALELLNNGNSSSSKRDFLLPPRKLTNEPRHIEFSDGNWGFVGAADIFSSEGHGEDMPPIGLQVSENAYLLAVGDGLGGSGSIVVETDSGNRTESKVASHELGRAILDQAQTNPDIFLTRSSRNMAEQIKRKITEPLFANMGERYPERTTTLRGSVVSSRFPTTLTLAVAQFVSESKSQYWNINLAVAGDSPIFVVTEEGVKSTYQPGAGDVSLGSDLLALDKHSLKPYSVKIPEHSPFLVLAATDFILKLDPNPLQGVKDLLVKSLDYMDDPTSFQDHLRAIYTQLIEQGAEIDDATLSLFACGKLARLPSFH